MNEKYFIRATIYARICALGGGPGLGIKRLSPVAVK